MLPLGGPNHTSQPLQIHFILGIPAPRSLSLTLWPHPLGLFMELPLLLSFPEWSLSPKVQDKKWQTAADKAGHRVIEKQAKRGANSTAYDLAWFSLTLCLRTWAYSQGSPTLYSSTWDFPLSLTLIHLIKCPVMWQTKNVKAWKNANSSLKEMFTVARVEFTYFERGFDVSNDNIFLLCWLRNKNIMSLNLPSRILAVL